MSLFENYTDIGKKLNSRYAINPISTPSGSPAPTSTSIGSNVTGYIYNSTSGGTVTISNAGSYCAILVQKGFNGGPAYSYAVYGTGGTTYQFFGGDGGGTGQMIVAYGWIDAGTYSYSINENTSFNGLVASNTSPSFTITSGFGSILSYASVNGSTGGYVTSASNTSASVAGYTSSRSSFPAPLNGISVIGGSGASGTCAPYNTTAIGGGAGGYNGAGGTANGGTIGAGNNATAYGAGGGGAPNYAYGTYTGVLGTIGSGGPGCVIIVPYELLTSKDLTTNTYIDKNYFSMTSSYSLSDFLDESLVRCLDSSSIISYSPPVLSTASYGVYYPFGSSDTITYLNGIGFKKMPFTLTGNPIKYAVVRSTNALYLNSYFLVIFAENSCVITLNVTAGISFICCGNGGASAGCSGSSPSLGAGGGGIAVGSFSASSGNVLTITRANGSNTVLSRTTGTALTITATAGGNSTASSAGSAGTASSSPSGYTTYTGGAGGASSGANGGAAGSTSITSDSGYVLTSTGFGGGGKAGTTTSYDGAGGNCGFGGVSTGSVFDRPGVGYGSGAGGQKGSTTALAVSGNPGVVFLSILI